ncbi:hypothetical protein, partial [Klebsiella grimontii]|uniref:hypothetical protein n=1 Tax=Klebsiella grimontii TaxID=2058152 RepID=UPI0029283EE4
ADTGSAKVALTEAIKSLSNVSGREAERQQTEAGHFGGSYGQMKCIITCKLRRDFNIKAVSFPGEP